jgi:cytochrome c biogenesis protein CcmG, thiol:disulfide interchange protein DsbE
MDHRERPHDGGVQRHAPARYPGDRRQALTTRWLAVVALAAVCWAPGRAEAQTLAPLLKALDLRAYAAGTTAPAFSGRTVEARPLGLADLRGKAVVMNFWATWCLECRPEMPALERLHRRFGARGLTVVGVNAREAPDVVRRYEAELGLSFPLVLDQPGTINAMYGIMGLPTTFVIGRDGRAVALAVGPRDWGSDAALALVQALLDEPTPARATP